MEDATALEVTPARKLAEAEAAGWPGTGLGTFVRTAGLKVHLKNEILVETSAVILMPLEGSFNGFSPISGRI